MLRFLNPKNDLVFKRLFGTEQNKDILIAFLNDIFEGVHDKIEEVEFLPLIQYPVIDAMRVSIVDVKCTDTKGREFIIEMQCASDPYFIKRACVYVSRAADQVLAKNPYRDIKPIIFLAILEFNLFPDKKAYFSHHKVQDVYTGECDIKEFSFSFLELKKIKKTLTEAKTTIEKWAYFFKEAQRVNREELDIIKQDYPVLGRAYAALDEYGYSKEELDAYLHYDMGADMVASGLEDAKLKGKAEGKAEGLAEGKAEGLAEGKAEGLAEGKAEAIRELAVKMFQNGVDKNIIASTTGLSMKEIEKIT